MRDSGDSQRSSAEVVLLLNPAAAAARMCDRACVDIAALLRPGEGMLLGNFASGASCFGLAAALQHRHGPSALAFDSIARFPGFFLVHSESLESAYINSRPFRVNAGAVSTYTVAPQGKTAYLTELKSGVEVDMPPLPSLPCRPSCDNAKLRPVVSGGGE